MITARSLAALAFTLSLALPASAQDSVYIEELTWTEIRDAIKAGKTTVILPTGGTEQNGPHMVMGKHNFIIHHTAGEIAKKLGVGLVGTNDVHFLTKEDHYAHDVLCCISMGKLITDEGRLKYPTELYLKSPQEMAQALSAFPEAVANTVRIAQMCNVDLDFSKRYAPVYRVPERDSGVGVSPTQRGQDAHATVNSASEFSHHARAPKRSLRDIPHRRDGEFPLSDRCSARDSTVSRPPLYHPRRSPFPRAASSPCRRRRRGGS